MLPLPFILPFMKANAIKLITGVILLTIVAFAYFQYKNNIKLQAENYNLQATVYETQVQMDLMKMKAEKITELNNELLDKERDLNQAIFDLSHKFTKKGRNFKNLARQKPGLVDNIINNAIRLHTDCLEKATMGEECLN